jgi:protein-S-isoprenylcysteine O-methyltransferase Ste14
VSIDDAELTVRLAGGVLLAIAWVVAGVGAVRALDRPTGRALGVARKEGALFAYLLAGGPYLLACVLLWRRLPVDPSDATRVACLAVGGSLGVVGFALYLWGRVALGDMYNVSSSLGSELFADHRLVASGPYRFVRHPMYLGIVLGALGGLLVYRTWTTVFAVLALPGLVVKARHEDGLLAEQLDGPFEAYRARVPAWVPRLPRSDDRMGGARPRHADHRTGGSRRRESQEPLAMGGA